MTARQTLERKIRDLRDEIDEKEADLDDLRASLFDTEDQLENLMDDPLEDELAAARADPRQIALPLPQINDRRSRKYSEIAAQSKP